MHESQSESLFGDDDCDDASWQFFCRIVYYAIVVTVIGFILWYYGVSKVPASTSAVFTGLIAVSTLFLSYLFLQESFQLEHLVGVLLVLFGIFITAYPSRKHTRDSSSSLEVQA
ncbi:DMT family transporter ['Paenibacillus yunnanensis' Narsing Rao et al. 2020]|uniref:DMT family transporter n=1 Tax=Paenibacillus tengchongensis TaxID=2608684 RepID=UPI00124DCD0D|nr:DMT family transporter [Paenibacillus tengchongensis]